MKFIDAWRVVESKNPKLKTGSVTLTSENFKRAMRWAYDRGREEGVSNKLFDGLFK